MRLHRAHFGHRPRLGRWAGPRSCRPHPTSRSTLHRPHPAGGGGDTGKDGWFNQPVENLDNLFHLPGFIDSARPWPCIVLSQELGLELRLVSGGARVDVFFAKPVRDDRGRLVAFANHGIDEARRLRWLYRLPRRRLPLRLCSAKLNGE